MRSFPPLRSKTPTTLRLLAVLVGLALIAAACGSDGSSTADLASEVDGIDTNEGGITVKPPDVLDGDTEVVGGEDPAAAPSPVPTRETSEVIVGGLIDAPNVDFTWFDGAAGSIEGLEGQPTVLNFWASTCAACIAEMPEFEDVFQDLQDEVAFVGMNTSDRREAADRLATQTGVTYPLAEDPQGEVFRNFGLFVMPTTILLTETGDIGYVWSGILTEKELRILIDEHIAPGTYEDV